MVGQHASYRRLVLPLLSGGVIDPRPCNGSPNFVYIVRQTRNGYEYLPKI